MTGSSDSLKGRLKSDCNFLSPRGPFERVALKSTEE